MATRETDKRGLKGWLVLAALPALLVTTGCMPRHSDAVLFSTNTTVGVEVAVDKMNQTPFIEVGYNRAELTYLPLYAYGDNVDYTGGGGGDNPRARCNKKSPTPSVDPINYTLGDMLMQAAAQIQGAKDFVKAGDATSAKSSVTSALKTLKAVYDVDPDAKVTKLAYDQAVALGNSPTEEDLGVVLQLVYLAASQPAYQKPINPDGLYKGIYTETVTIDDNGNPVIEKEHSNAYSVLGTFGGNLSTGANAGSQSANVNGGIVQFFATGLAADRLAESGADLVSVPAAVEKSSVKAAEAKIVEAEADKIKAQTAQIQALNLQQAQAQTQTYANTLGVIALITQNVDALSTDAEKVTYLQGLGFSDPEITRMRTNPADDQSPIASGEALNTVLRGGRFINKIQNTLIANGDKVQKQS